MNHLALDRLTGYNFQILISAHWNGNARLWGITVSLGIKEKHLTRRIFNCNKYAMFYMVAWLQA